MRRIFNGYGFSAFRYQRSIPEPEAPPEDVWISGQGQSVQLSPALPLGPESMMRWQ
jgi:hypothetical protein